MSINLGDTVYLAGATDVSFVVEDTGLGNGYIKVRDRNDVRFVFLEEMPTKTKKDT